MARSRNYKSTKSFNGCFGLSGCGCMLLIIFINLTIGAWLFGYDVKCVFGKDVPLGLAMLGGLFLGEAAIPVSGILWIVGACGVVFPLFK
jgi:hypothetical protein